MALNATAKTNNNNNHGKINQQSLNSINLSNSEHMNGTKCYSKNRDSKSLPLMEPGVEML